MPDGFDTIVIGKGMMGSATARHLALTDSKIALIGPDEPDDKTTHTGVFSSHYDEGRITRALDTNPDWARLAIRSISRYADIARTGKTEFFYQTGALLAGCEAYNDKINNVAAAYNIVCDEISGSDLNQRFPFFTFPKDTRALFEPDAGYINPRALVAAQTNAAYGAGAKVVRQQAVSLKEHAGHVSVTTADGQVFTAEKVIVAAGAFSNQLLPQPIPLNIYPRTIVLFELDTSEIQRLAGMPSLIHVPDENDGPYFLPPIQYPNGKTYLKFGGDPRDTFLTTPAEITEWFQGTGLPQGRDYLFGIIKDLMPELRFKSVKTAACVTTLTTSGKPVIQYQSNRIIALTGGNGAAAKSSDEIGRLGAVLALNGSLSTEGYSSDFTAG